MNIHIAGLMKLTLLDYPGNMACTVFFKGCNFRCPFCHNSEILEHGELDNASSIEYDEFIEFLKSRKGMLDGVCISGGEPTLYKELPELIKTVKDMGYKVKLDTNGQNPDMIKQLIDEQLIDYIAMDIKNSPDKYGITVGIDRFNVEKIEESIKIIISSPIDYEFRTTVVKEFHNKEDIKNMGVWLDSLRHSINCTYCKKDDKTSIKSLYLQPFEDKESVLYAGLHTVDITELEVFKEILGDYIQKVYIRTLE